MDPKSKLKRESSEQGLLAGFDAAPYPVGARSSMATISRLSWSTNPHDWQPGNFVSDGESDDESYYLEAGGKGKREKRTLSQVASSRGLGNASCLIFVIACLLALFVGYPIVTFVQKPYMSKNGGYNLGGTNASGQIPTLTGNWGLIDKDTSSDLYTRTSLDGKTEYQLVFSDEFNVDGRSFYPGDDPYWEAENLHYWGTNNLEWYDPAAITTSDGALTITLSNTLNHDLNYMGGMVTTWNKFCFTGGYIETSVQLPGSANVYGLWPAIWTMGNLGRAGYGASLEGMWPYSYDACDVGTLKNQTLNGVPATATVNGDESKGGVLSYLPGQKLSRCTCPGEAHPGPKHFDGSYVGRAAPEIDILEAQVDTTTLIGGVSQSAQWAPFNEAYKWQNTTDNLSITDSTISALNTYSGSATQQATSVVTRTNQQCYQNSGQCFSTYGFEYKPGFDEGYITWVSDNKISWSMKAAGMGADADVQVSARPVSEEPMYIIANLGLSEGFSEIDTAHLTFPAIMKIDYIRVYQPTKAINVGCNPKDFPTTSYIEKYNGAYTNPNLTTWVDDFKQTWPKNKFAGDC
ncbi:beta-glucan synthesis-associated [Crepidotus variabilis]|uniref:Beta-glucan synthesis-associated n=1 Tax=Crepidotus variabilis TaxID=179855 RepID=A0A9P6EMG9_9AGAR|nr:beta-glucan synthesis-associated [Crepidotus variabilis]